MALISTHDKTFELQEGETLLEGLERTGHEVEYQCRSGYCGSCRVKILDGRVSYDDFPLAFVASGEILPCCCRVNEDIKIDCRTRISEPESTGTAIRIPVCVSFRPSCSCTFTPTIASIIQIMKQTVKANVLKISTE